MVESRVATTQGRNIGRLTKVTVVSHYYRNVAVQVTIDTMKVYLPLSLGTVCKSEHLRPCPLANGDQAIFSMAILPKQASWVVYALLIALLTAFTLIMAFRKDLINTIKWSWQRDARKETSEFP